MTSRCRHPQNRRSTTTRPFTGPISSARSENRAAHGGCCYVESCAACGAERRTNVNGSHQETGRWVPLTDSEVIARGFAVVARDDAREAVSPVDAVRAAARALAPFQLFGPLASGRTLTISVDPETFEILVEGPHSNAELPGILDAVVRTHGEWFAIARAAREAVRTADLSA